LFEMSDFSSLIPLVLLSGNYGNNNRGCNRNNNNNDNLLPFVFLAGSSVFGSGSSSLLPLALLGNGFGNNNNRRCRRRRQLRRLGYAGSGRYAGSGYY
ncbi:hypothetical protein OV760_28810, partial [Salmonella enterica subsp. enterica serovar 1,4,[5],12:i:-]|nr:hypothetical protein [Salmonella enterica subsp. enterica serovar 1,4,[5],12:i:-]